MADLTDIDRDRILQRLASHPRWEAWDRDRKRRMALLAFERARRRLDAQSNAVEDPFVAMEPNAYAKRTAESLRKLFRDPARGGVAITIPPDAEKYGEMGRYSVYRWRVPGKPATLWARVDAETGRTELADPKSFSDPTMLITGERGRWIPARTPVTGPFRDVPPRAELKRRIEKMAEAGRISPLVKEQRLQRWQAAMLARQYNIPESSAEAYLQMGPIRFGEAVKSGWVRSIPGFGIGWETGRLLKLQQAVKRLREMQEERPEADLTDTPEYRLVDDFLHKRAELAIRGHTLGGLVAKGIIELPPFMIEFLATSGWGAVGKRLARRQLLRVAGRGAGARAAARLAGVVGSAGARALHPISLARLGEGTLQRMLPKDMRVTRRGQLIIDEAGEKPLRAFLRAFGDLAIEYISEMSGGHARRWLRSTGRAGQAAARVAKVRGIDKVLDIARSVGWDGLGEEWLEERIGGALRGAFGIDEQTRGQDLFTRLVEGVSPGSAKEALAEILTLAVPAGVVHGARRLTRAEAVRSDQEVPAEEGVQPEGGEAERGEDLQREAEAGAEAREPMVPPEAEAEAEAQEAAGVEEEARAEEAGPPVRLVHPHYQDQTPVPESGEAPFSFVYQPPGESAEEPSEAGRHRIEQPELVQVVKDLLGSTPAIVRNRLRFRKNQPYGRFVYSGEGGRIELRHDIFIGPVISTGTVPKANAESVIQELIDQIVEQTGLSPEDIVVRRESAGAGKLRVSFYHRDPDFAAHVLAHEIGHAADWLPEKTMKRGNILGRIASLHRYIGEYLEREPGAEKPLTAEEREELRREAERAARVTYEEEVDEEIERTLPLTPDEVLAIWNSTMDVRRVNPDLWAYVAGLSTAAKKSIAAKVLRGEVPEELQRFGRRIRETRRTRRAVTREGTREEVLAKYRELFEAEVRRRQLWEREKIMEELKALTRWWHPFDPTVNRSYTRYRYSSEELYADAISVLLNNPGEMERRAPMFTQAFFSWLGQKPEVKALYEQIQSDIRSGEAFPARVRRLRESLVKGNVARREQLRHKEKGRIAKSLLTLFVDVAGVIKSDVREAKKAGVAVSPKEDPGLAYEHAVYGGTEVELYRDRVKRDVARPLRNAGLEWLDLEEFAFHQRVINERGEMANPHGWSPKTSEQRLDELREQLGADRYEALEQAHDRFWRLRQELVLPKIEAERMWSPELLSYARDNKSYVKFSVTEFIEKSTNLGSRVTSSVFRQYGTLKEIAGPVSETILKDAALLRAADWNRAKRLDVAFLQQAGEVAPAEKIVDRNGRIEFKEATAEGKALLVYLQDGKPQGYYVDKWHAEAFGRPEKRSRAATLGINLLNATGNAFRSVFTVYNPGFWAFNIWRDWKRATLNLRGARRYNILSRRFFGRYLLKGLKPAFRSVFALPDDVVDEMRQKHMLISVGNYRGRLAEDVTLDRYVQDLQGKRTAWTRHVTAPFLWLGENMRKVAEGIERTNKVASFLYLKENFPELSDEEIAHIVRTQAGSPSFLTKGRLQPITNNIFLFSNAFVQATRANYSVLKDRPGEIALKIARRVLVPTALKWCVRSGALVAFLKAIGAGDDDDELVWAKTLEKLFRNVTHYDMLSYMPIPLGFAPNGKTIYFRMPMEEGERLVGGVFYKLLDMAFESTTDGDWAQLLEYGAGQLPSINPAISTTVQVVQFLTGHNPYDYFRQRTVVPETEFAAGGWAATREFLKHLANQNGFSLVYRFRYATATEAATELEEVLDMPGLGNTLGRFIKVSDYGTVQDLNEIAEMESKRRAREILRVREIIRREMEGKPLRPEEEETLVQEAAYAKRRRKREEAYSQGGYWRALAGKTRAERDAVTLEIAKREGPEFDLAPLVQTELTEVYRELRSRETSMSRRRELHRWLRERHLTLADARAAYARQVRERRRR